MFDFDILHPFSTFNSDPAYNGKFNGATGMIMQSQQDTDMLIKDFKQVILQGFDPNDVADIIFEQRNIDPADLLPHDKKRLVREIEEFCKSVH